MSFADELRKAEAKLKAKLEQETKKKGRSPRKRVAGSTSGRSRATAEWKIEDDIIALYLAMTSASKFFRENYSKKRKIPLRSMVRRMEVYTDVLKGKQNNDVNDQMQKVVKEFSHFQHEDLQKIVIRILRGEYFYHAQGSSQSSQSSDAPQERAVLRKSNDGE